MTGQRRLSQAISEGDGISLIVPVADAETARTSEARGAEGVIVDRELTGLRQATSLPILWRAEGSPAEALALGADACLVAAEEIDEDRERIERRYAEALDLGLDCVVEVRRPEELERALERLDPEIFLLSPQSRGGEEEALEHVLDLLPDLPAGKLAIADVEVTSPEEIEQLERAGVDAVIVGVQSIAGLVRAAPPEV
jgi:indole-3-glycerol phosphate synthase